MSRVRLIVAGVLRFVGRCAIRGLIGMQTTWHVVTPEADEAGNGGPRLSAAEREAWADLEQRLR